MSDLTPETITDAQVDEYFNNQGSFKDSQPEVSKTPEPVVEYNADNFAEIERKVEEERKRKGMKDITPDAPVNQGALHEERTRRKAEQDRARKAEERAAELERRLLQFEKPREESNDDDPIESLKKQNQQLTKVVAAIVNKDLDQDKDTKYWNKIKDSELAYKQDVPDFDDAIAFLAEAEKLEYMEAGFTEEEAKKVLQDKIKWIADKAYADEVNPAERFYKLAKKRGFSAKPPEQDKSADIKLDTIQKGMQANKQLPPGSSSLRQDITAESLADMNVDALTSLNGSSEFDKAWAKLFGASH